VKDQHLITVDELRAAGALDVPAGWRKSLARGGDTQSGLFDEEACADEQGEATPRERKGALPKGGGTASGARVG
jgi:hypothetical protein